MRPAFPLFRLVVAWAPALVLLGAAPAGAVEWEARIDARGSIYRHTDVGTVTETVTDDGETQTRPTLLTRLPFMGAAAFDVTGVPVLGRASFHGMLRYRSDFLGPDSLGVLKEHRVEFLYAYIDWTDPKSRVELRLGRQYLFDLHRFEAVDAARVRVRLPIPLVLEALVGSPVTGFDPLRKQRGADIFGGGSNALDGPDWGGADYGVLTQFALELADHTHTRFRLLFRHRQSSNIWEQALGISLSQRMGAFGVHGDLTVDTLAGRVSGADAGVSWRPRYTDALHVDYSLVAPQFGPNAIFWAFDFKPFHRWAVRGHGMINDKVQVGGRAAVSLLTARKTDADGERYEDVLADRVAWDLKVHALVGRPGTPRLGLSVTWEDGAGGRRAGPGVRTELRPNEHVDIDAGLEALYAVDAIQPSQVGWVTAVDISARFRLGEHAWIRVMAANYTTPFTPLQLRARLEAGARFGGGRK